MIFGKKGLKTVSTEKTYDSLAVEYRCLLCCDTNSVRSHLLPTGIFWLLSELKATVHGNQNAIDQLCSLADTGTESYSKTAFRVNNDAQKNVNLKAITP